MFVLVALSDPGLHMLPTHRLVGRLVDYSVGAMLSAVARDFDAADAPMGPDRMSEFADEYLPQRGEHTLGLYDGQGRKLYMLRPKHPDILAKLAPDQSADWRSLDVSIAHRAMLEELVQPKFSPASPLAFEYTHDPATIAQRVDGRRIQFALILQPTPVKALVDLSKHGEVMPQKSTYFVPKLATGGGDPGIGKSTLILQALDKLCAGGLVALYISGEESEAQLKLRAERLGLDSPNLLVATETCLENIFRIVAEVRPAFLALDSIQTMYTASLPAAPGSLPQVRETAFRLVQQAKMNNMATFLIGHVTKEGALAGPMVLEHLVDTVLYLEGDRSHTFRLLRTVKNRFGPTQELGVFEMQTDAALRKTWTAAFSNMLLVSENAGTWRKSGTTGTSVFEANFSNSGLVEVQSGTVRLSGGGTLGGSFLRGAEGGLAAAGRPPEDDRAQLVTLDRSPERASRAEDPIVPHQLVE